MSHPHPFTLTGNRVFNMFLWMPPSAGRAGDILMADSTIFTMLFGGDQTLEHFWKYIAARLEMVPSGAASAEPDIDGGGTQACRFERLRGSPAPWIW